MKLLIKCIDAEQIDSSLTWFTLINETYFSFYTSLLSAAFLIFIDWDYRNVTLTELETIAWPFIRLTTSEQHSPFESL